MTAFIFTACGKRRWPGVADGISAEIVQKYLEQTAIPTLAEYLFDYPIYLAVVSSTIILLVLMAALYIQSSRSKKRQEKISGELAAALERTEEATMAKQDFFSKMSHDIRTPLNVVLRHDCRSLRNIKMTRRSWKVP